MQRNVVHAGMPLPLQRQAVRAAVYATVCAPLTSDYEVIYEATSDYQLVQRHLQVDGLLQGKAIATSALSVTFFEIRRAV